MCILEYPLFCRKDGRGERHPMTSTKNPRHLNHAGFTLIELVMVIMILAIVAGLAWLAAKERQLRSSSEYSSCHCFKS